MKIFVIPVSIRYRSRRLAIADNLCRALANFTTMEVFNYKENSFSKEIEIHSDILELDESVFSFLRGFETACNTIEYFEK